MRVACVTGYLVLTVPIVLGDMNLLRDVATDRKKPRLATSDQVSFRNGSQQQQPGRSSLRPQNSLGLLSDGVLKNDPFSSIGKRLCDLTSTDADTGILSCGDGHFCMSLSGSDVHGVCALIALNDDGASGIGVESSSHENDDDTMSGALHVHFRKLEDYPYYESYPSDSGDIEIVYIIVMVFGAWTIISAIMSCCDEGRTGPTNAEGAPCQQNSVSGAGPPNPNPTAAPEAPPTCICIITSILQFYRIYDMITCFMAIFCEG